MLIEASNTIMNTYSSQQTQLIQNAIAECRHMD